jgi:uncharacterized surface protein with fasciclin (FAS1) repeats
MALASLMAAPAAFADHCATHGAEGTSAQTTGAQAAVVPAKAGADIITTATAAGSFKTLITAISAAGLTDALKGQGPFTVFAPTDEAFAKLPAGTVESLLKDKAKLTEILKYHVVAGQVTAADVSKLSLAKTLEGQDLKIATKDGVTVNGAKVLKADVMASNGVIHVIDQVLVPEAKTSATAQ